MNAADCFQLSCAQKRLWILNQLQPESAAYNVPVRLRLIGEVDQVRLSHALVTLIERHESLRTVFRKSDSGNPLQYVQPTPDQSGLEVIDYRGSFEESTIEQLVSAYSALAFDLSKGPLYRAVLIKVSSNTFEFLLVLHHIICDGTSLRIISDELGAIYSNLAVGKPPLHGLREQILQYADYSLWEQEFLSSDRVEQMLGVWRRYLDGCPQLLTLECDYPRPEQRTSAGGIHSQPLPAGIVSKLQSVTKRHQITLSTITLSLFAILLARNSKLKDFCIALAVENRIEEPLEHVVGFFANTVAIRFKINQSQTFIEFCQGTQKQFFEMFDYHTLPFDVLVERLAPQRSASYNPLVQHMFVLHHGDIGVPVLSQLEVRRIPVSTHTAMFDLSMRILNGSSGLEVEFEYDSELFSLERIQLLSNWYFDSIERLCDTPDIPILELLLPSKAECARIDSACSGVRSSGGPVPKSLSDRIRETFVSCSTRIAIREGNTTLTYADLEFRSSAIANELIKEYQSSGINIALLGPCNADYLSALFGILRSGHTFVPIDDSLPEQRIESLILQTRCQVIFASGASADLGRVAKDNKLPLRNIAQIGRAHPAERIQVDFGDERPAYILATSGSTGKPKAVVISRASILNHIEWMESTFGMGTSDVSIQSSSLSFDASIAEIFSSLCCGGILVCSSPRILLHPVKFASELIKESVTSLQIVPSLLAHLVETPAFRECRSLKRVWAGGEVLVPSLANKFFNVCEADLYNTYGPTEATIDTLYHKCDRSREYRQVPLGKPISNTRVYILDDSGRELPTGVSGQLAIEGVGLAIGYLNNPELTSEMFPLLSEHTQSRSRVYLTGDQCRLSIAGEIEFLGRKDRQVKLHGNRIELIEIEEAARLVSKGSAAVAFVEKDCGKSELFLAVESCELSEESLRHGLSKILPRNMIPRFVQITSDLPKLSSGKLDIRAIQSNFPRPEAGEYHSPQFKPETRPLQLVLSCWSELLGFKIDDPEANFFDLGGHSLLAIQMVSKLESSLGYPVNINLLFSRPTAKLFSEAVLLNANQSLPKTASSLPTLVCVHPLGGTTLCYHELKTELNSSMHIVGINASLEPSASSISELAENYVRELRYLQPAGPYSLLGWSFGGILVFEMAVILERQGEVVNGLFILDAESVDSSLSDRTSLNQRSLAAIRRLLKYPQIDTVDSEPTFRTRLKEVETWAFTNHSMPAESFSALFSSVHRMFFLLATYSPSTRDGNATIIRASGNKNFENDLGWKNYIHGQLDVHTVSGSHDSILRYPAVSQVAQILQMKATGSCRVTEEKSKAQFVSNVGV